MSDEWVETTLGDLVTLVKGISYRSSELAESDGRPFLNLKNVARNGGYRHEGLKRYLGEGRSEQRANPGDVLVALTDLTRDMAVVGSPVVVPDDSELVNSWFSLDLARLVPTDPGRVLLAFLRLVLEANPARDFMKRVTSGTTVMHLNTKAALGMPLTLPPVDEQLRIVDLISSIDAAIDATQETQRSQHVACAALREARVFGAGWPIEKLGEHLSDIDGGRSPVTEGRAPTTGERAVLGLGAVQQARFDASQAKAISDSVEMPDKAVARPGDVLITRSNTPERVGLVAMVPDDVASDLFLSDLTLRLHPRESLDRWYLVEAMSAGSARSMISGMARGTSGSMRKISRELIRSMKLPMPPIEDQRLIAAELSAVTAATERTDAVLSKLERLRKSALGALLSGTHEIPESYDRFLEEAS